MTRSLCQPSTAEAQGQLVAQGGRVRTTRGEGRGTEDRRLQGGGGRRIGAGMPQPKKPVHDNLLVPPFEILNNKSDAKMDFNCYVHCQPAGAEKSPLPRSGDKCPGAHGCEGCHPLTTRVLLSCINCMKPIPGKGRARLQTLIEWRARIQDMRVYGYDMATLWRNVQHKFAAPAGFEWVEDMPERISMILCDDELCYDTAWRLAHSKDDEPAQAITLAPAPQYQHIPSWCWLLSNKISWLLADPHGKTDYDFMISQLPQEIWLAIPPADKTGTEWDSGGQHSPKEEKRRWQMLEMFLSWLRVMCNAKISDRQHCRSVEFRVVLQALTLSLTKVSPPKMLLNCNSF